LKIPLLNKPEKIQLTRDLLYNRHRLSHQQIDDFFGEKESKKYLPEKLRQMAQLHDFFFVTDTFSNAGISFISLKGPLLSYRVYNDATYRRYKDFDFLIELHTIEKAVNLLQELGYKPAYFKWPKDNRRRRLIVKHDKHISMYHPDKNTAIELHWKLFDARITSPAIMCQIISANQTTLEYAGRIYLTFNTELELLYLIIHGGLVNWFRLKWLVDIKRMLDTQPVNTAKLSELISILKAERMIALYNSITPEYFADAKKLPSKQKELPLLKKFSLEAIQNSGGYENYRGFVLLKSFIVNLLAFPGYKYKYDVVKRNLFHSQSLGNEQIPSFSIIYYLLGFTKRIFNRFKITRSN
jgi:Uncharacterised nucleotidyltransferase